MNIKLRKATMEDAETLLRWRNDPLVYQHYFTPQPIDRGTHFEWLASSLRSSSREIYIAEAEEGAVGMIRFDFDDNGCAELSWAVDPKKQGKGIGTAILKEARRISDRILIAEIKSENIASIKIALASGFDFEREEQGVRYYRSLSK